MLAISLLLLIAAVVVGVIEGTISGTANFVCYYEI